jgi:hypothetical protein
VTIVVVLSMMLTPALALAGDRLAPHRPPRGVPEDALPFLPEGIHHHHHRRLTGSAPQIERMAKTEIRERDRQHPNNVNRARRHGLPVYYGDAGRIR